MRSIIAAPLTPIALLTLGFLGPNSALAHTAAYNEGFSMGQHDKAAGNDENAVNACGSTDNFGTGVNLQHCVVGYLDGYNGH